MRERERERERKRERERVNTVLPSMYQTNTNAAHVNSIIKRYFTYMKLYPVCRVKVVGVV
jgi:hypothetical protein